MGSSQQFSLRWNNYLKHITCAFDTLRSDEDLVDVTLSCEGKRIRAHKMLLSACSTYFRDLFKENPCQHPVIIFRNVKFDDLAALVDFMYQGEVNVVQEQLGSFLTTAELLAVQGLTDGTGKDTDSMLEDDTDLPNEPEVQLQNAPSALTTSNHGSTSPSSPAHFSTLDIQTETPPNKRRKCRESGSNVDKGTTSNTVSSKDSERKTTSDSNTTSGDSVEIIPLMPNLKLEMPEYLEQDGSSCSYEEQSAGESSTNRIALEVNPSEGKFNHEHKPDISHSFYSANQSTSDASLETKNLSVDQGHLLSKPSTSGERLSQEAAQGGSMKRTDLWYPITEATGRVKYVCKMCGAKYSHLQTMTGHFKLHWGQTICYLCGKVFSRKPHLVRHLLQKHSVDWSRRGKCKTTTPDTHNRINSAFKSK
ncbi:protein tramtrack, beta isoform-like isoform X4 [Athalia rosae]|uniref:protein tramtrack, beta isoform-like isoform X4 n=1 Tax=Athalia rosae TaxID=37344 RepID=UPI002034672D|nr:protein tramtrack, beta isoform-like isoform X4 [Athalia rosae]